MLLHLSMYDYTSESDPARDFNALLLFCCPPEAATAEAQFIADANEVIGLQSDDNVTTQAPLSTVEPIGERL